MGPLSAVLAFPGVSTIPRVQVTPQLLLTVSGLGDILGIVELGYRPVENVCSWGDWS